MIIYQYRLKFFFYTQNTIFHLQFTENLRLIEKTFRNPEFIKIKEAIQLDSSSYNIKVMKLFNKTFYKQIINLDKINNFFTNEINYYI